MILPLDDLMRQRVDRVADGREATSSTRYSATTRTVAAELAASWVRRAAGDDISLADLDAVCSVSSAALDAAAQAHRRHQRVAA